MLTNRTLARINNRPRNVTAYITGRYHNLGVLFGCLVFRARWPSTRFALDAPQPEAG